MVVRTMLWRGCCHVRDAPEFCACVLNNNDLESLTLYLSFNTRAQIRGEARNFATSSEKSIPQLMKKESRGAKSSTFNPASSPRSTYPNPSASVTDRSWTALYPAARM